ncbi:hypothetical protein Pmani_016775 [Petrolisthes manimaculis]|uniref:Uncharacterized protein n=1 Tax=Petrolisthes manimaculis TaxID=1843537 RepID=A0AAE1PNK0_9EUCA|nr:hypothetical protein Pmani_016775 [Petrolisthes manimaculis]
MNGPGAKEVLRSSTWQSKNEQSLSTASWNLERHDPLTSAFPASAFRVGGRLQWDVMGSRGMGLLLQDDV